MRILVIIPAYNEMDSILDVIKSVNSVANNLDYLVINDCSTDKSSELLYDNRESYINLPVNLGIGGAVQAGYKYALKNDYDIAIQIDGDGQHNPIYVKDMIELIESGEADVVIGSRFIEKEGFQSSASRRFGINFLSGLIRIVSGVRVKDVTSGYRAVNRRMIRVFADNYPDDYPEPEVIVTSSLYGARIREIPVVMKERMAGKSSINLKKSIYYMIKVSLAIIICRISLGFRRG